MLLTNNTRIKDTGRRLKRIYSRVNTKLYDGTAEYGRRVQMGKGICRSRVC